MTKIMITGGTGFIGRHLCERLISSGADVLVADRLAPEYIPGAADAIRMDITDYDHVRSVFRKLGHSLEFVIHLAAYANVVGAQENPVLTANVNIGGAWNIAKAAAEASVQRLIFLSSSAVYGKQENEFDPIDESAVLCPENLYGFSKLMGERFIQDTDSSLGNVILRGANIYGPGQSHSGGAIPIFLGKIAKYEPPLLRGSGNAVRDFTYVSDVASAIERTLTSPPGVYNVGSGKGYAIKEVWDLLSDICRLKGFEAPVPEYGPLSPGETRCTVLSNTKAREIMGWSPKISLEEGLEITADHFLKEYFGKGGI